MVGDAHCSFVIAKGREFVREDSFVTRVMERCTRRVNLFYNFDKIASAPDTCSCVTSIHSLDAVVGQIYLP